MNLKTSSSTNTNSKTWVMLMKKNFLNTDGDESPDIVKLRHPRSRLTAIYQFSHDNSTVHEVFSFKEKRSWFINDSVRENGTLYFCTPIDPFFLILPYLKKTKEEGKVVPLEDLLIDDEYPETHRLLKSSVINKMDLIADRKGPEDLNAWMYNEGKTINWLKKKTENVARVLKEKNINVRESAKSKNYVKVIKDEPEDRELHLSYAHKLVSEYLTEDLSFKLSSSLGLPDPVPEEPHLIKRKLTEKNIQSERKKTKIDEEISSPPAPSKPQGLSAKEKANRKAASGTKAITSFFKKK